MLGELTVKLKKAAVAAALAAGLVGLASNSAVAETVLDLTPGGLTLTQTSSSGSTFIVANDGTQAAGTGVLDPFLHLHHTGAEQGFNTSTSAAQMADVTDVHTQNLLLGSISKVTIGTTSYRQFLLDVNQVGNGPISLNQIQIFQSSSAIAAGTSSFTSNASTSTNAVLALSGATSLFQMSAASTSGTSFTVSATSNSGSGQADMVFLVPDALFTGLSASTYITLYSHFGNPPGSLESNDGFEEWATFHGQGGGGGPSGGSLDTPLPGAAIAGIPLLGLVALRRRFSRRSA